MVPPTSSNSNSQQIPTGCLTNLAQLLHCLFGNSIRSHRLKAQSHKTDPPLQIPITSPDCKSGSLVLLTSQLEIGGFHNPFLGSDNLLEWLTKLRGTFTYIYEFIIKDIIRNTDELTDEEVYVGPGPKRS